MKKFLLLLLPLGLHAVTLNSVVSKIETNELMQSMQYLTEAQKKVLSSIKEAYMPKLSMNALYSYINEDQRGLFDPESSASLEASWVLFDGFRRYHTIKAQGAQVSQSKEQELHQRESLTLNAINLYFSLRTLQADIDAKEQKFKQLEEEVERLVKFYQAGSISEDKVEQIKAARAMTQYELALLRQNFEDISMSLASLTGEAVSAPQPAALIAPNFTQEGVSHDIKAATLAIDALSHQAQSKNADYWPSLIVKDTYSATGYYPANFSLPGVELSLPAATNKIQLVAQITLFDFFSKSNEKASLFLQKKAKEAELAYKKRDLTMKQKLSKTKIQTAQSKIEAAMQNLKSSEKSFQFIKERFKVNLVDSITYLDALTNFYQAKALLAASKNDLQTAFAHYYFNFGIPLKEKIQ